MNPELGGNALPLALIHPIAWNMDSANFALPGFSEVDTAALCVAPSQSGKNSYVEITGSWPCLHKILSGAGRWIRANFDFTGSTKFGCRAGSKACSRLFSQELV